MFCENCGAEIKDGENFCSECGTKISQEVVSNKKEEKNVPNNVVVYADKNLKKLQESTAPTCLTALENVKVAVKKADISDVSVDTSLSNILMGTGGIDKVKKEAKIIFKRYEKLANSYKTGKKVSLELIEEFSKIRDDINKVYQLYIDEIKDIFGNKAVHSIAPDVFDFKSVQFLDVDAMLNNFTMEYDSLMNNCETLMEAIDASFSSGAQRVVESGINSLVDGDSSEFLSTAVVEGITHYATAYEQTNLMKAELEELKNSLSHDVKNIQADEMRIFVIAKNLNDLFIPQANAFYLNAQNVMSDDLNAVIDSAYSTEELKTLRKERNELYKQYNEQNNALAETTKELSETNTNITEAENLLEAKKDDWKVALRKRIFLNIWNAGFLAFIGFYLVPKFMEADSTGWKVFIGVIGGILILNRILRISKWHKEWGPLWKYCKEIRKILKANKNYQIICEMDIQQKKETQKETSRLIDEKNTLLRSKINADDSIKSEVASHLTDLVKVLKVGKSVLEQKLNSEWLKPINFPSIQDISLSENAQKTIASMITVRNEALSSMSQKQISFNQTANSPENELSQRDVQSYNRDTAENMAAITAVTSILTSELALREKQQKGQLAEEKYDEALKDLQNQFMSQIKTLDNQADVLNEALKKVNLAVNHDDMVQALSELAYNGKENISKKDIEDMLSGKKVLEI